MSANMQSKYENLSALVDSEIKDASLLDDMSNNEQLRQKWQSYHVIGDVLRKEVPQQTDLNFVDKISAAIDDEPTVLAPKEHRWSQLPFVAQVVPLVKQGSQYAIAASVAAVMVIGVQVYNQPTLEEPFELAPNASAPGVVGRISGVSLEQTRPLENVDVNTQKRRINALILDHQTQMKLKSSSSIQESKDEQTQGETDQPNH
jgi:sigma-E factor negative regulatory protein RseA